jgi:hypothetical protein
MAYIPLQTYFDKQDSFEIVRDQIAGILATEIANQKALAQADGKDPAEWDAAVYLERINPWEKWLNINTETATEVDKRPIINVWYDSDNPADNSTDTVERTWVEGTFNIDCYGYGQAERTAGGHTVGDRSAVFEAHRALRLVRNILMSANCVYLGLRGLVGRRAHRSRQAFQTDPQLAVQNLYATRFQLSVWFEELSPQYEGQPLEVINLDTMRAEDGEIVAQYQIDFTQ